jgi:hypothetical protein
MPDDDKQKNWWQTLPGVMTGIAATLTAAGGFLVAVKQTGWLDAKAPAERSSPARSGADAATGEAASSSSVAINSAATDTQKPVSAPSSASNNGGVRTIALPQPRDYTLQQQGGFQKTKFTFLKIEMALQSSDTALLTIRLRALNEDRFDINFWDRGFRLLIDGVPREPSNTLNELVASNSAREGEVAFPVPKTLKAASLRILHANQTVDVALDLSAAK